MRIPTSAFKNIGLAGVDWTKVLAVDTFRFEQMEEWSNYSLISPRYFRKTFGMIRFLTADLWQTKWIPEGDLSEKSTFLFFKSLNRSDYDAFFGGVAAGLDGVRMVNYNDKSLVKEKNDRARSLFFKHIFTLIRLSAKIGTFPAFYFYTKIIRYLDVLLQLQGIKPERVVVFADMHPLDNLVSQYFGNTGVKTATMQHGLYVDYGDEHTVNTLNYRNVVSQYFLAWGDRTAQLIRQYHPKVKTKIVGKPALQGLLDAAKTHNHFVVLFDQKIYSAQNQALLDIASRVAKQLNLKVLIKLHPTTRREQYQFAEELEADSSATLETAQFCLGHTTSMIYELLRRGMPVFKLTSPVATHKLPEDFQFSDAEELLGKINKKPDCISVGKEFVAYIGNESLNKYQEVLKAL